MKKTRRVEVRFSEKEYNELSVIADKGDTTVSDVVRRSATKVKTITLGAKRAQQESAREIAKIGNNLNQIARWVNTHKSNADAITILTHLREIDKSIKRLYDAD